MPSPDIADEIEITPEMIEAGVLEWRRFNEFFDSPDVGVTLIYRAMAYARRGSENHAGVSREVSHDLNGRNGCRSPLRES
jgi:hypothetical protein